ncbi:MAG: hypothetical protein HRU32_00835 [Rhodobacteraceae bacterium]|nr:hypothetical protein [Paracoccaceae bacterium]
MNPNILLGGLLVGGLVVAGGAMFFNGDFSAAPQKEVATQTESSAPKLAIRTPSALGGLFSGSLSTASNSNFKTPQEAVRTESYGYDIRHPAMISDTGTLHFAHEVLTGLPKADYAVPQTAEQLTVSAECTLPPVPEGAQLVNLHVGQSHLASPFKQYSNTRMAQLVGDWIGQVTLRSSYVDDAPDPGPSTGMVNVAVTEAAGPLYFVLQSGVEPVVWNLQTSPNLEIAQIVMIGYPGQTVVPPKGITSDQITALEVGETCAPAPSRAPAGHWGLIVHGVSDSTYETRAIRRYQTYNAWFEDQFGQPSEVGAVGAWTVSNLLIGAVPQSEAGTGMAYQPITDRTVFYTPSDNFFFTAGAAARAEEQTAQLELAARAAGGDIARLTPAPMERDQ